MVTNGDKGGGGSKFGIFTVTYFLNGPYLIYLSVTLATMLSSSSTYSDVPNKGSLLAWFSLRSFVR